MKVLYSQSTQEIKPYPRNDDEPIVGLDNDYLILKKVNTVPNPSFNFPISTYTIDLDNLEYRQEWSEDTTVLNWDGFNVFMLSDSMLKNYRDTVRTVDGDLNAALFNAYSVVATNGVGAFANVWGVWAQVSGITAQDKATIAATAESFNLPQEFIDVIAA